MVGRLNFRTVLKVLVFPAIAWASMATAENVRFATYPDVSTDHVVFEYRDSIWLAPLAGGQARLLSDVGSRPRHPKFSPDGSKIAYTATVNDNEDVFVVDLLGGPIRRVTNHPARDEVTDWHPDGTTILFKSTMQSSRAVYNRLFRVAADGGFPELIPIPYVETAAIDATGETIFFTYLRDFQEEVWKRYLGGRAPDIWSFDMAAGETAQLTQHAAPDSMPMIQGNSVYFLSERGPARRSNIWMLERDSETFSQVTNYSTSDVRNPSIGPAGIIFELDGELLLLPEGAATPVKVPIDFRIARDELVRRRVDLGERIENASIGPDSVIAFEARGDVLLYDVEHNSAKNVSNSSNAAERFPVLSPDGSMLAYQSDIDGEYQLYVKDLSTNDTKRLTNFESGFRYRPSWSPDGRYLAFMDQQQTIWLVDRRDGSNRRIDKGHWRYHWDMPSFRISWSPDSQWMAYSRAGENRNQSIYVYNIGSRTLTQLTSGFFSDFDPVFAPNGNYLIARALRSFVPTFGDIDPTFTYRDSTVVTLLPLTRNVGVPSDIGWENPGAVEKVQIDIADAEARLMLLPFPPGSYIHQAFVGEGIVAVGVEDGETRVLKHKLGEDKVETFWTGKNTRVLDANESTLLLKGEESGLQLIDSSDDKSTRKLDPKKLTANIDPAQEFLQMFDDSWRYQRDFFYDPGLHGVDWQAAKEKYRPLAEQAHSAQELTAIIREMHAELAAGHVYVSVEPSYNRSDAENVGLLGINFLVNDGAYQIAEILRAGPRRVDVRSPLDNAALDVSEGDYVLAVNGRPLTPGEAPWVAFEGLAEQVVDLTVADNADGKNSRAIHIKTLSSERKLRELVWVERNRQLVDAASGGRIGYIYVPNTGAEGQNELMQMYRAQYHKDALIIDERFNTGGALGDRFVELLNRPPLNYFSSRSASDYPLPELAHRGPKAMLINSWSYSGGDGFPFLFKTAGVGPLIGTRTWGGLIGPGMRMSLINGGFISAPPQRVYDVDGNWAEGNEGVRPNVHLQNDPGELARGNDQQLKHAIAWLLDELDAMPPIVVPAFPNQMPLPPTGE